MEWETNNPYWGPSKVFGFFWGPGIPNPVSSPRVSSPCVPLVSPFFSLSARQCHALGWSLLFLPSSKCQTRNGRPVSPSNVLPTKGICPCGRCDPSLNDTIPNQIIMTAWSWLLAHSQGRARELTLCLLFSLSCINFPSSPVWHSLLRLGWTSSSSY